MRPEYYTESRGINQSPVDQDATTRSSESKIPSPTILDEYTDVEDTTTHLTHQNAALGPHFDVHEPDSKEVRELYTSSDIELARVVARRIKLGMFATRRTREELDSEIDGRAEMYEVHAGSLDRLMIDEWRKSNPDLDEEGLARRLADYHAEQERLHELHIHEAFHDIQRFGVLSRWNDRLSEWYVGLTREYRVGVALGVTAVSAAVSGMAAWSSESLGPTAAVIGGGMLAGAKLYKAYNQARLGLYEQWGRGETLNEAEGVGAKRKLGRAVLERVQHAGARLTSFAGKLFHRPNRVEVSEVEDFNDVAQEGDGYREPEPVRSSDELHVEVMTRMERRRRERVEHADKVNKRARIIVIGAGALTAIGIGSRFIDFGKIVDWFDGGPPVGGVPTSSPTPTPTGVIPSPSETPSPPAGPSLPLPPEVPQPSEVPPVPHPPQPEYSLAARTVEDGEGWYQTFSDMGITNPTSQANLLQVVGPKLAAHGWAYIMPDGSYGITNPGILPREALDLITKGRRELVG